MADLPLIAAPRRWRPRAGLRGRGAAPPIAADALARAVHDLVAPLTVIRGQCVALARAVPDPGVQLRAAAIDAEAARLAEALHGFGDLVASAPPRRLSGGAPIDLVEFAETVAARHRAGFEQRGMSILVHCSHPRVEVTGSASELRRVLDNLILNALRHLRAGGSVTLRVGRRSGVAELRVADDGLGVDPRDRERIFRPRERGRSPRGAGRGLGLAIAREIAVAHRGSLELEAGGRGACFLLRLPERGVS